MRTCHYCSNYFVSLSDKDSNYYMSICLLGVKDINKDKYGKDICDNCYKELNLYVKCIKCDEEFKNKNLKKHIKKCMSKIKCYYCGVSLIETLDYDEIKTFNAEKYICEFCD